MKNLFAVISMMLCLALASYAGPIRPSFSSRPSYSGGFRSSSSPSYRSFSPSRTFTFSRPAAAPRLAAAPRSYTYSAPKAIATPVSRSTVKRTVVNNHYHGSEGSSGGGGLSLMDVVAINALTSHNNSPTYVNTQPVVAGGYSQPVVANDSYQSSPAVICQREESHFWSNLLWFVFGSCCLYGVYRLFKYLLVEV